MRKITRDAVQAFYTSTSFARGNTHVVVEPGFKVRLFLHGNEIARKVGTKLYISNAGWCTRTTSERLHGLVSQDRYCTVRIKKGHMYYTDAWEDQKEVTDEWLQV